MRDLVPLRYERMLESPFTFFRGSAAVMAWDLARTPSTGIVVQACGDAHSANFGGFGTPERSLVYDINDFDETAPAPWEFDVKRLAAALVLEVRDGGFGAHVGSEGVHAAVARYVTTMSELAGRTALDIHYAHVSTDDYLSRDLAPKVERATRRWERKARRRTNLQAFRKWIERDEAGDHFRSDPPVLTSLADSQVESLRSALEAYRAGLPAHRRGLLDQYRFLDAAHKVVGVGSVGLRSYVVLLEGPGEPDPLMLQFKEAVRSVLEVHAGARVVAPHGRRVVEGQRVMQAAGDPFLGWVTMGGRDYYVRQLRDMKSVTDAFRSRAEILATAELTGGTLARAHARSLDPACISGYLGRGGRFIDAVGRFAVAYADQAERDHRDACLAHR